MKKYRLSVVDYRPYILKFWDCTENNISEQAEDYLEYIEEEKEKVREHFAEIILIINQWVFNCAIPKENFTIYEIEDDKIKVYTYQEVWDMLPKRRVKFLHDLEKVTRYNDDTLLEEVRDIETGELLCITNSFNLFLMPYCEKIESCNDLGHEDFETLEYFLEKANGKNAGALAISRYMYGYVEK